MASTHVKDAGESAYLDDGLVEGDEEALGDLDAFQRGVGEDQPPLLELLYAAAANPNPQTHQKWVFFPSTSSPQPT
jgi:hypothetical protein